MSRAMETPLATRPGDTRLRAHPVLPLSPSEAEIVVSLIVAELERNRNTQGDAQDALLHLLSHLRQPPQASPVGLQLPSELNRGVFRSKVFDRRNWSRLGVRLRQAVNGRTGPVRTRRLRHRGLLHI
jgi:hypothetical protein